MRRHRFRLPRATVASALSALVFLLASVAVSAQVPPPAADASPPDGIYTPYTNREIYQRIAADYQEIAALTDRVLNGSPLPASEILTIYENAKIAVIGAQSRPLRGFAREAPRATEFPAAAQFYGSPTFLDDPVIEAINGTGSAANYTPAQRREAIQKGIQRIIYYWTARYVDQAAEALNPGLVDEAWAIYMGEQLDGRYPNSLSATAVSREQNFNRPGSIDAPLRQALSRAQIAAGDKDAAAYAAASRDAYSRLHAIFYLGAARYMNQALQTVGDGDAGTAAAQQIEGLYYYMTIQPTVAMADPEADRTIVAYFTTPPTSLTSTLRNEALSALNRASDALMLQPGDLVTPATFN